VVGVRVFRKSTSPEDGLFMKFAQSRSWGLAPTFPMIADTTAGHQIVAPDSGAVAYDAVKTGVGVREYASRRVLLFRDTFETAGTCSECDEPER
jgi:hypothetical protein